MADRPSEPSSEPSAGGGRYTLAARFRRRGREALARRFGVDARALAAFRVSLGLLVLADLLLRARHLVAFYTDDGVLPRTLLRERSPALARLSLHAVAGEAWVQALLFAVAGAFAVALVVGYRTRLATLASFLLLASLHARNPLVLNAGDSLLRRLLLWSVFLPLGERLSVDARRREDQRERVVSLAAAALLLQVVLVYSVNAAFKFRGQLWERGDAILYVFSLDQFTVLLGDVLARYPALLEALGHLWLAMLVASPLLVLLTGRPRTLLVSGFVAMHLGMALSMQIGVFPLVAVAALLPLLPAGVWDAAGARLAGRPSRWATVDQFSVPDRLSVPDRSSGPDRLSVPDRSSGPDRLSVPDRWRERLDVRSRPTLPGAPDGRHAVARWWDRVATPLVAVLLALVLVWNAATLGVVAVPADAVPADPAEHRWDMFAPSPPRTDGWFVVPGRLESGERVDAFHRSPVRWDRPPDVARSYPTARWRKYMMDLVAEDGGPLARGFARHLCRRWNARHEDGLVAVNVTFVAQPTRLDGPEPTRRVDLGSYECPGSRDSGT